MPYRPVTAEFSTALDRIILISANPNQLHIYDPVTNSEKAVNLAKPPLSLSVSLDGTHAVVGHDALISYVNLGTGVLEKTVTVAATVSSVVLGNDWAYVLSYSSGVTAVQISTGAVSGAYGVYEGSKGRLHPSGRALYTTEDGISPEHLIDINVSTGPPTSADDGRYHGDYGVCGGVWFSPDGRRVYTGCGTAYQSAPQNVGGFLQLGAQLDGMYWGALAGAGRIRSLSESAPLGRLAVIPDAATYGSSAKDNQVLLYESAFLEPAGSLQLPDFTAGTNTYQAHGQQVFFNKSSTALYVVMQADGTSGLLNDFAVQIIPVGNPSPCVTAFNSTPAAMDAGGTVTTATITAGVDCIYQAASNVSWIQLISGAYGSGNGTLTYAVRPNSGASRTGTITIGDQTLTVTQLAPPSTPPTLTSLGVSVAGTVYGAGYTKALDKLVYITAAPKELHIYDPSTGEDTIVALPKVPLCLSVGPDGLSAAVGYDGWISLVNLANGRIISNIQALTDVHSILLGGKGYVYAYPLSTWGHLFSFEIATGAMSVQSSIYDGRDPQLYADGNTFYTEASKWDISQGIAKQGSTSGSSGVCAPIWLAEDGTRMFTGCAKAYTTSPVPSLDLQYNGSLSNATAVQWAAESAKMHSTAIIPGIGYSQATSTADTTLQMYGDQYLGFTGSLALPGFMVGTTQYAGHGRFVFWNNAADKLIVLEQADSQSKLAADYGVVVYPLAAPAADCTIALPSTMATFDQNGGLNNIPVSTGANCIWEAVSNATWITVNAGAVGFGSNAVNYAVAANTTTSGRTGTLTVAGQTFTVTQAPGTLTLATLSSPAPGSTLAGSTVTFTWNAVSGADYYWLDVGNTVGQGDISAGAQTTISKTVSGLPCDGRTLYVQLYTFVNSAWQTPQRYTFTACGPLPAQLTAPAPGSTLAGSTVAFMWNAVSGADNYWLDVGNGIGQGDISAGALTETSKTVSGLPCDGRTLYVQLYTHVNSAWQTPQRYTFTACGQQVGRVTSPPPGSTLAGSMATFTWTVVSGADNYWLDVGSGVGQGDISAGALTATSKTVSGLPCDGRTLYVQLYTHVNSAWQAPQRYTFTACGQQLARLTSPAPGSTLAGSAVTFTWNTVSGADNYWLDVGNGVGQGDISAGALTATSKTVSGLPCDGRTVYVQLFTHVSSAWQTPQRYTFTACGQQLARLTSPVPGSALAGTSANFTWNAVSGANNYWLDVGNGVGLGDISAGALTATSKTVSGLPCDGRTLYVQLYTYVSSAWQTPQRYTFTACGQQLARLTSPAPGSTFAGSTVSFAWNAVSGADNYWLDVGNAVGLGDISAGALTATSKAVSGLPCDGRTLYVQLYTHVNSAWQAPQRYTFTACGQQLARLTGPVPGSTLPGSTATFTWNAVSGADNYWLDVGNAVGLGDISAGALTATSQAVSGLPCDGRTLYVQLFTHVSSAWQAPERYTFTAATGCASAAWQFIGPVPPASLAGETATVASATAAGPELLD